MIRIFVLVLAFFLFASLNFAWVSPSIFINLPSFTGTPQITTEQAKEIVRQWEGDPTLELPDPILDWEGSDPFSYPQYIFKANKYYIVDALRGYVSGVIFALYPSSAQWTISPLQAEQIAREFCSQKYPNFSQINWECEVEQQEIFPVYEVTLRGKMPNGAWMLNACVVDIHPQTGEILAYIASIPHSPPPTWEPSISQERALAIAINATGFAEVLEVEGIELGGGEGVLLWGIGGIRGIFPDGSVGRAWLMIDALSGEVRYRDYSASRNWQALRGYIMVLGKLIKRTEGPLFVGEKAFVSEKLFKALGGDPSKAKFKVGESIVKGGKHFISADLLKRALPNVVWDIITNKERNSLLIILYGDDKGLASLPAEKFLAIHEAWYEPKWVKEKKVLTYAERDKAITQWVERETKIRKQNRVIKSRLKAAKLFASSREIKKEFPKPYVDWEKIAKQLRNQKSTSSTSGFAETLRGQRLGILKDLLIPKSSR